MKADKPRDKHVQFIDKKKFKDGKLGKQSMILLIRPRKISLIYNCRIQRSEIIQRVGRGVRPEFIKNIQ